MYCTDTSLNCTNEAHIRFYAHSPALIKHLFRVYIIHSYINKALYSTDMSFTATLISTHCTHKKKKHPTHVHIQRTSWLCRRCSSWGSSRSGLVRVSLPKQSATTLRMPSSLISQCSNRIPHVSSTYGCRNEICACYE